MKRITPIYPEVWALSMIQSGLLFGTYGALTGVTPLGWSGYALALVGMLWAARITYGGPR